MKIKFILLLLLFSFRAFAIFGEDTALMIQLVTTTASQLNELEKLVTNAEKYTNRLQEYNTLIQDEYFKAERISYLAQELAAKKEVEDLGELNYAIRELKYSMGELQGLMRSYAKIQNDDRKTTEKIKILRKVNDSKVARAKKQVANSITARNTGRATQLTAQNTALMHESQLSMHPT